MSACRCNAWILLCAVWRRYKGKVCVRNALEAQYTDVQDAVLANKTLQRRKLRSRSSAP